MSLIKCKECGKEISDKCSKCIHCGAEVENNKKNKIEAFSKAGVCCAVISLILINPLGILGILAMIFGGIGVTKSKEKNLSTVAANCAILGGCISTIIYIYNFYTALNSLDSLLNIL